MVKKIEAGIARTLKKCQKGLLADWMKEQLAAITLRPELMNEPELRQQSAKFLSVLQEAIAAGNLADIEAPEWAEVRELLGDISRSRAEQGFSPSETATFVFSFKQPFFKYLREELAQDPESLNEATWTATLLLDKLGLFTTEVYQQSREDIIRRQQREIVELSTPVVRLWESILAVPVIGTLDSERTRMVMENLLQEIAETGSDVAIIDITGVPMVDTEVAQHLLKTVAATRLMGAECLISGMRPEIAQTIVQMGIELGEVITKATLADALALAFQRIGITVSRP